MKKARRIDMDTKKLRQKILDLAIRGKLVPQDPNDEPASVLLERIRAEKERLIKEGKIKRSKKSASDTPHYENVPFEVPESWEWLNVESFTYDLQYGTSEKSSNEGDIPVLRMGNITRIGTIDFADLVYSSNKDDISKYALLKDDLLFNRTNSSEWVGKTAIFKSDLPAIYAGYLIRVRCILVCPDYINFVLNSSYHRDWCNSVKTDAVNQSNINAQKLSKHLIPIPPYEEQLRIVAETKIWMNVIDKLDCDVSEFEQVISKIKSKILDLAIHGKLVPQDPNDEPAIELLKRINPKFTPCDNAHYENMPSNWTTILLGDLCFTINGLWKGKKPPFVNVGVIRNANFTKDCKLDYTNIAYLDVEVKQYEKRKLQCGDIIVEKSGGSDNQPVGRTILFGRKDGDYSFSNFTSVLRIYDGYPAIPEFLNMFLQSIYQTGVTKRMQTQTTGIHNLIFDQFLAIPVLLPPIAEQSRIIKKVNELFPLLDNISADL